MTHPDDLVELGKITGAYGLKGWVTVVPASSQPEVLLKCKHWWLSELVAEPSSTKSGPAAQISKKQANLRYRSFEALSVKPHADRLVAHLMGVENRELAEGLKGARVYVSRAKFPAPSPDEYYWVDLEGCEVVNLQGVKLGVVSQVVDHGAHPILSVGKQLIPFVPAFIKEVQVAQKQITVDWQEDYL